MVCKLCDHPYPLLKVSAQFLSKRGTDQDPLSQGAQQREREREREREIVRQTDRQIDRQKMNEC